MLQVPHDEGHLAAVPCDPAGARGGPLQDGGEGRRQEQLQAIAPRTES